VRRDLELLDEAGLVHKVHGGAVLRNEYSADEPRFETKAHREVAEKEAIARAGAELVSDGSAIGLTGGSTTWRLAAHLVDVANLTVVTNSVPISDVFHQSPRPDRVVVLTGGTRTLSDALVGPAAVNTLRMVHLDMVFMGVHGMSRRAGFTTPNMVEAETNRAFVTATERLVVMADHTKWGVSGLSTIAPLTAADTLVCDSGLGKDARHEVRQHVGQLLVADPAADQDHHETRRRA